jgi:hypothetical protein
MAKIKSAHFRRLGSHAVLCLPGVTSNSNRRRSRLEMASGSVAERRRVRVVPEKSESAMCDFFAIRNVARVDFSRVRFVSNCGISLLEMCRPNVRCGSLPTELRACERLPTSRTNCGGLTAERKSEAFVGLSFVVMTARSQRQQRKRKPKMTG